jgi:peptide-methionine (S)-S-oxide reductase
LCADRRTTLRCLPANVKNPSRPDVPGAAAYKDTRPVIQTSYAAGDRSDAMNEPIQPGARETATLAGGCFWCLEAVFEQLRGVERVESGYTGGQVPNASYEEVCTGKTGHAEAVQVAFDPAVISYRELLEVFFAIHDPTTLNRQGADVGTQYRSAIFYHTPEQQRNAETLIAELNARKIWDRPIVTELTPATMFYGAEEYHQGYFRNHPSQGYCQVVIAPKVAKLRKSFAQKLRDGAH